MKFLSNICASFFTDSLSPNFLNHQVMVSQSAAVKDGTSVIYLIYTSLIVLMLLSLNLLH